MSTDLTQYAVPTAPEAQISFREIRIAGSSMSDISDIPDEHLYIVGYGDSANEDLGKEIDCIVLRQSMKAIGKWNDDDPSNRHYMYQSTEFNTFSDVVVLYDTHAIPSRIVAALPYSHKNPNLPSIGGKGEKALKGKLELRLRYVYYILYNGEVFRINGGSTDYTGADGNDKPFGFSSPQEGSFMSFLQDCGDDTVFSYHCTLSGKKHSKKITLKQFKKGKKTTEKEAEGVAEALSELYEGLNEAHWTRFGKAMDATPDGALDEWSQKIVDILKEQTFDALLRGRGSEMFKVSLDSLPDVVDVKVLESGEESIGDLDKDSIAGAFKSNTKIEDVPF